MALDTVVWVGAGLFGERGGPREEEDRSWVRKYSGGQGMRWSEYNLALPCRNLRSLRVFMGGFLQRREVGAAGAVEFFR
jgi:hypothetical protein